MKVFLFDFDGVITDTLPIAVEVYNQMMEKYAVSFRFTPQSFADLFLDNFHKGLSEAIPDSAVREKILKEKNAEYERRKDDFRIFDGVKEMLFDLSKVGKMIIISSNGTNFIKALLQSRGIDSFDEVLGGDIEKSKVKKINWQKEKYLDAVIYYIGDTTGDVRESKETNIKAVAVTWGFHSREVLEKEHPDYLFDTPKELINILTK
jgi:phosphoglycolate phosphatase